MPSVTLMSATSLEVLKNFYLEQVLYLQIQVGSHRYRSWRGRHRSLRSDTLLRYSRPPRVHISYPRNLRGTCSGSHSQDPHKLRPSHRPRPHTHCHSHHRKCLSKWKIPDVTKVRAAKISVCEWRLHLMHNSSSFVFIGMLMINLSLHRLSHRFIITTIRRNLNLRP